jgi:type IV pilus assembly protein PilM
MSFWEDRFVNRPHASAVPAESPAEGPDPETTSESEVSGNGHAWSYLPETPETSGSENGAFENGVSDYAAAATEPEIEPVYEYEIEIEPTHEYGVEFPETAKIEFPESDEDEDELEDEDMAASIEIDESPAVEYKRRGLFRRRKLVPVAIALEDEAAESEAIQPEHFEPEDFEPELEPGFAVTTEFVGNGYAWSYVPDTNVSENGAPELTGAYATDAYAPDAYAVHEYSIELPESDEDEDELEDEDLAASTEIDESPAVEYKRRGLFRRRKAVPVAVALEDEAAEDEAIQHEEPQHEEPEHVEHSEPEHYEPAFTPAATEFVGNGHAWSYVPDTNVSDDGVSEYGVTDYAAAASEPEIEPEIEPETEPEIEPLTEYEIEPVNEYEIEPADEYGIELPESDEDELEDEDLAASIEIEESPAVESKRRGLFRRRKAVPAAMALEDGAQDEDHESGTVEDDAFDNVPLYAEEPAVAPSYDWPNDEVAAAEEETPEPQFADADAFVMAETDDSEATPAEEPEVAPELAPEDDQVADEPETEFAPVETFELEAADTVAEYEPEPEQPFDVPVTSLQDEPVVLRKRSSGGSSRGKKVVGLKVGASQIAAAVVTGSGDRPALVDLARRPLEPGVVVDGELRDPEALAHALKSFFKDHGLPVKNVRLGLSSSRVGVRTFEIAGIDDDERFDNAVRFKAHEVLPVAAHESVLDYRVVEERYTESGEISRRVLLVVAPRDQVEPYIKACHSAGLRLAGLDLEAFGLLRAFVSPLGSRSRSDDSATVVAAIGHEASTLLVAGGGVCEFTRVFDWGGGALQAAIADELEVPLMEASTILNHLSLSGPGRHLDSLDADTRSRAIEAVRTRLTPFARELVSSLQFYQTQPDSLGIKEILITGGTSHLEGLAEVLHQMIGVNVSVGDPLGRVSVETEIPVALDATIGSLAVPIGLAIEDEAARSVNLIPKDVRHARKRPNMLAIGVPVAAAVPLVALAFLFVGAHGAASDHQAQLDAVQAEIAKLPEPTRPNIDPALAGEQASRATAVAQVLGGRLSWERVLGDISRVLPSGVSLTELIATTPQPATPVVAAPTTDSTSTSTTTTATPAPAPAPAAAPTTPTGVTVTGYAFDYASIARALARIQAVPSLTNAQLQSATPADLGQKRVIEFTIVADLATATSGGVVQ